MSIKKILANITRADYDYNLIEDGDKIAVGVSGGKDSMLLLKVLKAYQRFKTKNFTFVAVFLDLGFGNVDKITLEQYCKEIDVELVINDSTDVYTILQHHKNSSGNLPCSICSRMKKAAINKVAHELKCNKVAFAHHLDDAIETFLMNAIYGGRVATFAPKMHLTDTDLVFIRPFILVREKDITATCRNENIPIIKSACPNDHVTMREEAKQMLNYLYKTYPSSFYNLQNMLTDKEHLDLWFNKFEFPLYKDFVVKECVDQQDFFEVMSIRINVYCKEQGIDPSIELDDIDKSDKTRFYLLKHKGKSIGTISVYQIEEKVFKFRRFALLKEYRHQKIGSKLLMYVESLIAQRHNPCKIIFGAQYGLKEYYEKMGYTAVGDIFLDAGIKHIHMEKTIKTAIKYKKID